MILHDFTSKYPTTSSNIQQPYPSRAAAGLNLMGAIQGQGIELLVATLESLVDLFLRKDLIVSTGVGWGWGCRYKPVTPCC